ncbi:hypothetical protein VOM14_23110 [Paraburkholderia sp. MPAMCS5]|uniref:hypothetical protein n=1 Tax=Paraburkholderia sp. MPAMCS5 TaxID=3112563 RepID=UPI002E177764|nr:hypothetical protein [Paraburkholderia sp. MPAMCS5]
MTTLAEQSELIARDLEAGGFASEATEIRNLLETARDESQSTTMRVKALEQIHMRCHVKWFGDLYIPQLTQKEWWCRLEALSRATQKMQKSL